MKEQEVAGPGEIFICGACGKTNRERYGHWDTSCMTWAVLCREDSIERDEIGRINKATAVGHVEKIMTSVSAAPDGPTEVRE